MNSQPDRPTARTAFPALVCLLLLASRYPAGAAGQGAPSACSPRAADSSRIVPWRVAVVGGGLAATVAAIHFYQQSGWWKNNRAPFHFREDLTYGLGVDKLGHVYGGISAAYVFRKSFLWAGMGDRQAYWWGSASSLLFQTYVEVEDGFSTWGFDRVDWASDVAGAAYPLLQHYWPPARDLEMKFSYHPSVLLNEAGGAGFRGQTHIMFDDYEGQTIWFSLNVRNVLPAPVDRYWPPWLWVALGYGARDVARPTPYRVFFLALDFDATKIIPQDTAFLRTLSEVINFWHLPAPADRISPGAVWYGLYF